MSEPPYSLQKVETSVQLLEFHACGRSFACNLLWVKEVLRAPVVTPVKLSPDYVRGVIHLRGQILTALDLEARIGHPLERQRPLSRCIVFKTAADIARLPEPPADADLADSEPTGLLVDSIGDILPPGSRILPSPPETLSGLESRFIAGVISGQNGLTTVLNVGILLSYMEPQKNA